MPAVKTFDGELLTGIAPGTWVAISADQKRVVATGSTIEQAIQNAKDAGENEQPFIYRNLGMQLGYATRRTANMRSRNGRASQSLTDRSL